MKNKILIGHIITLITMFIWGTTYISTKILLENITPIEILFYRFLIAYFVLLIIYPKIRKVTNIKEEILFMLAGLTGVTLYFFLENVALDYTLASNVGLFIASAPILTAIFSSFVNKNEKINSNIIYGFIISIIGIFLVIFNGSFILKLNPLGDCLAILAAFVWAIYSVILKKIGDNYSYIYVTRKVFFYGVIFIIPILFITKTSINFGKLLIPSVTINMAFLSLIASCMCFVMWNTGISIIGPVKASNYIYMVPLITASASAIVLKEEITKVVMIGAVFILVGLYLAQNGFNNPFKYFYDKLKKGNLYENK